MRRPLALPLCLPINSQKVPMPRRKKRTLRPTRGCFRSSSTLSPLSATTFCKNTPRHLFHQTTSCCTNHYISRKADDQIPTSVWRAPRQERQQAHYKSPSNKCITKNSNGQAALHPSRSKSPQKKQKQKQSLLSFLLSPAYRLQSCLGAVYAVLFIILKSTHVSKFLFVFLPSLDKSTNKS